MSNDILFKQISDALVEMEEETVVKVCSKTLEMNIPTFETITKALILGMDRQISFMRKKKRTIT